MYDTERGGLHTAGSGVQVWWWASTGAVQHGLERAAQVPGAAMRSVVMEQRVCEVIYVCLARSNTFKVVATAARTIAETNYVLRYQLYTKKSVFIVAMGTY